MNLGEKIEQLLKTTAMTKVELSKKLGLKDSSVVSHWVKNRFKPDRDNVAKLSDVFEKPVSYFTDDGYSYSRRNDEDNLEKKIHELISALPQTSHLGVIAEISEKNFSIPYYNQPEELLPIMLETKNSAPFALKISSQEACPWAQKGEYLIIVPSSGEGAGKLVLAKEGGLYSIKKVSKHKSKTHLILEDFDKKQYKYKAQEAEIIGKVLAFYRKP